MTSTLLKPGKLPPELLRQVFGGCPPLPDDVLLGPAVGEDAAALRVGEEVVVAATDPITMTGSGVGAHAVLINANDVAVMGVEPRWFLATVLLPEGSSEAGFRELFEGMVEALSQVGATLVGGHTEVTSAVNQCVVVGQMLGRAGPHGIVKTGGLEPGDRIIQVGYAPVEGAAVLAESFGDRLAELPEAHLAAARTAIETPGISVVKPALLAAELGATALHDPTEGGLSAGLYEMAEASGVRITLNADAVLWFEPGREICRALGASPWGMLASGALLAGTRPESEAALLGAMAEAGLPAAVVGVAREGNGVALDDGATLPRFERDELSRLLAS